MAHAKKVIFFTAGTVPTEYGAIDTIDPDTIQIINLEIDQAVIEDGDTFDLAGETVTVSVVDNVATLSIAANKGIVTDGEVLPEDQQGTVTMHVANNVVTGANFIDS